MWRKWEQTPWAVQKIRFGVILSNIEGARADFGRRPKIPNVAFSNFVDGPKNEKIENFDQNRKLLGDVRHGSGSGREAPWDAQKTRFGVVPSSLERAGASFWRGAEISLCHIFKVEKMKKSIFRPKIEIRLEVRGMGPGGRKACPGGAWERFLASYKRPSTAKKIYQISIFGRFRGRIGAEIWTRRMPRNTKSARARSGAKKPAGVGGGTLGRPKNLILGGSEQFGARWGRFLARGRNFPR